MKVQILEGKQVIEVLDRETGETVGVIRTNDYAMMLRKRGKLDDSKFVCLIVEAA